MPEKKRCQMERKENKVRFCERSEVLADWKWLLTYSRRCKKMIALYIALGVLGTTVGLFGSVAGKYLIDIVTGYDTARLPLLVFAAIGSTAVSIAFDCVVSRVLKKLEIDLNNNVRADVFDRILDADWQALHAFSCGDILNRFETDTGCARCFSSSGFTAPRWRSSRSAARRWCCCCLPPCSKSGGHLKISCAASAAK